ncbi:HSP90 family protein [Paenibacillus marinisediminis]
MNNRQEFRFQVNLSGMINILSNHLYSSPRVYLRELLQNATDAIRAREQVDQSFSSRITVEVLDDPNSPSLMIEDNGIGLTEEDIHQFLAMIGHSSKTDQDFIGSETSFIGRFGIGLLSCFMVSDEIVVLTQSIHGGPSLQWSGKPDGTYMITKLETTLSPGTRVFLRCKPESEIYFDTEMVKDLLYYYGALLPYPISFSVDGKRELINGEQPEWIESPDLARTRRSEVLNYGRKLLGESFYDYIPIHTANGRTAGIAYIIPHHVSMNMRRTHKVYLKQMLVSDQAENILPEWAFFVKCIIWTDELQPTASREHFYEDERLEQVREELGQSIRDELMRMGQYEQNRLQQIIHLHTLSMKALAIEDSQFLNTIYRWLTFESTYGDTTLGELLRENKNLYYTRTVDEYKQISNVASAQGQLIVNAGYIYDADLLERLSYIRYELNLEQIGAEDISLTFTDLTLEERNKHYDALHIADQVLQKYRCKAELKRFQPADLPVLFTLSKDSSVMRSLENAKEVSTSLFASVLNSIGASFNESSYSTLYLNLNNPIVERILSAARSDILPTTIELLYCNALMMGRHPMTRTEMSAFNQGLMQFMNWGLSIDFNSKGGSA